jgi:hypothetical protein
MVNNSTNINKTNNHLSPSLTKYKKHDNLTMDILVMSWDRHKNVARLNRLLGSQLSSLDLCVVIETDGIIVYSVSTLTWFIFI